MKRVIWGFVVLVVCVAGAAAYFRIDAAAATPRLLTSKVTRGAIVQMVSSTGTLQPVDTVEVGTQVSGTIKTLGADFNSIVKKSQVIATLDPALFESQVEQARASVARLRADVEQSRVNVKDTQQKLARAKALQSEQLIAQSDFDAAQIAAEASAAAVKSQEAQLGQSEAALRQSEVSLSNSIIRTPVDGIVLSRNVQVGQTVSAGLQAPTLFIIARNLATMQLNASVNEADIGLVQTAQPVSFTVDAYGEQRFEGKVREVRLQPTTTNNVVTYTVVIDVPNAEQKLKPGMTATVSIEVARADDVVRVPAAAVRFQPTAAVLVAINGKSAEDGTVNGKSSNPSPRRGNGTWTRRNSSATGSANASSATANASSAAASPSPATSSPATSSPATSPSPILVWTLEAGRLTPVRATTGLSDGTQVALLNTSLQPGAEIVTGLLKASTASAPPSASQSSSPLMPSMPRRGPGGGPGGGPRA